VQHKLHPLFLVRGFNNRKQSRGRSGAILNILKILFGLLPLQNSGKSVLMTQPSPFSPLQSLYIVSSETVGNSTTTIVYNIICCLTRRNFPLKLILDIKSAGILLRLTATEGRLRSFQYFLKAKYRGLSPVIRRQPPGKARKGAKAI
jgi:hypothetical protein